MKPFIGIFLVLLMFKGELKAQGSPADTLRVDTSSLAKFRKSIPFIDSLTNDSLKTILIQRFKIKTPTNKIGKTKDPLDPFENENFIRKSLGKFWFFVVSMLILGVLLYFRNAFPNQMQLRLKSLVSSYHFRELTTDFGISFASGSVVAGIVSTLILSQAIVIIVVYSGFVNLNTAIFYILVVVVVVLWKLLLFSAQRLQAFILDISEVSRNQTQRQINIDFGISILLFPLITISYYNASFLQSVDVAFATAIIITIWFSLRVILEFLGLFRESGVSVSGILYFCGFEILPHAVLLTALFRMYNA